MKILITGGAGFIGSNLTKRLLDKGHQVWAVDNFLTGRLSNLSSIASNKKFSFARCGVESNEFVEFCKEDGKIIKFDRVYHFACATGVPNIAILAEEMLRACSTGTFNVLEVARAADADLLFTSSSEIYGDPLQSPQAEDYTGNVDPIGPRANYEEGKRFSETLVAHFVKRYGLRARTVRLFNVYGPNMALDDQRVIPQFMVQALSGKPLTVQGDGSQVRTLCYVDDILNGFEIVITKGAPGEVYNLGSDRQLTIKELAQILIDLTGSSSVMSYVPRPAHDHKSRLPVLDKIRSLGWTSQTIDLYVGLALMAGNFKERLAAEPQHATAMASQPQT